MFFRFHCEFVTLIVHFTKHQNFFGIEVVNFYFLKDCSDLFPLLRTGNKCFLKRKKKNIGINFGQNGYFKNLYQYPLQFHNYCIP